MKPQQTKRSIQILSRKPRTQEVSLLVEEGNEASEVVRVTFKELPDSEFESLEAQYRGRLSVFARFFRETEELEEKLRAELPESEQGKEMQLAQQQSKVRFNNLLESLNEMRREIVTKVVIGHSAEDFEFSDLPTPEDPEDLRAEVAAILADFSVEEADIQEAFKVGYIRLPFKPLSWEHERRGTTVLMPGAHPETVRMYERFKPGGKLLHSICNAAISWHKLNLKSAESIKADLKNRRLKHREQAFRIAELERLGVLSIEGKEFLQGLEPDDFEQTVKIISVAISGTLSKFKVEALQAQPPVLLSINGEVSLNPK